MSSLSAFAAVDWFSDLPTNAAPEVVGRRLTDQFLRTRPEQYCPPGYRGNGYHDEGYGSGVYVQYSVLSLWANAIELARVTGDTNREERLVRLYDDFLPGGKKHKLCSKPYHVDDTIFGVVPLQVFLQNGDLRCKAQGLAYADTQWTPPCAKTIKARHAAPANVQSNYWAMGYTPQTRLWIDDMYMIIALQSQAYRATGERKYIERAAKEMCFYLDELQLRDGKAKGLFYHAPDVPFVWGRGDGWMAAGMTLVLKYLPKDSEWRPRILAGYRLMMETLLKYQRPDGKWSQLVDEPDDPRNWAESSSSAMFAYAFITGVRHGWLKGKTYAPAAKKAWMALVASLDEYGNLPETCCGTGKENNHQYYFDRIRSHGDPHGQAPMLWCAVALLEKDVRLAQIAPPPMGALAVRPTFCSCGWHWTCGHEVKGLVAECRKVGAAAWQTGFPPEYFPETRSSRASFVNLEEDTEYEMRLKSGGNVLKTETFRTWKSDVPVARTVEIDPATFKAPHTITEKGTPDGWIRFVVKGGTLDVREAETAFVLDGAAHVILEGMTIRARPGSAHVIFLRRTHDVRIRACDISGWGCVGEPDYLGKLRGKRTDGIRRGWFDYIDYNGAINIGRGSANTVVERCYIHDSAARSNGWRHSHPAGPQAVIADHAGPGTVLRYNDFIGSDLHRFNDGIEGPGNFDPDGGLNRDADVYGNFVIFCNDDNIELDGGQQNVRCFLNRFEGAHCGVSVQGCMAGPSYVFENVFTGGGDEYALDGRPVKLDETSPYGDLAVTTVIDNEAYLPYRKKEPKPSNTRYTRRNNRFYGTRATTVALPRRPIPYTLDKSRIDFGDGAAGVRALPTAGTAGRSPRDIRSARDSRAHSPGECAREVTSTTGFATSTSATVTATVGGDGYEQPFEVKVNRDFPWLKVSPAKGILKSGEKVSFTVSVDAAQLHDRHEYRGAFLVRTADGFSRPVSVYVAGDYENPARPDVVGGFAAYLERDKSDAVAFDIPKAGRYCVLAWMREKPGVMRTDNVSRLAAKVSVDGGKAETCRFSAYSHWSWQLLGLAEPGDTMYSVFDWMPGRHRIVFEGQDRPDSPVEVGDVVVTDRPEAFEPR